MGKQPEVAKMFEYRSGAINLIGFPSSSVLYRLGATLGSEVSLAHYERDISGKKGLTGLTPSFPSEYIPQRRAFFEGLPENFDMSKSLFDRMFPRVKDAGCSVDDFLFLCQNVYDIVEISRRELKAYGHLPEARKILRGLGNFDGRLEGMLRTLNAIEGVRTFAVDTESGAIVPIDKMPKRDNKLFYEKGGLTDEIGALVSEVRVKMKRAALDLRVNGREGFKKGIVKFVKDEFRFNPEVDNIRRNFEHLALPLRLHARYEEFLDREEERYEDELEKEDEERDLDESVQAIAPAIYPQFARHYDIRNLVPPSLLRDWGSPAEFVPIDFRTKSSERKFLLAGLYSGGKSFFLENIVLASILGQVPLKMPADRIVIPKFDRIFYYRNPENGGNGVGKMESELRKIKEITRDAEAGDLYVFDEFLDSTNAGGSAHLIPKLLKYLKKLKSTVFISTHRDVNYRKQEENGWTLISPCHEIREGKVEPTHVLKRGRPDGRATVRYADEKFDEIFNRQD